MRMVEAKNEQRDLTFHDPWGTVLLAWNLHCGCGNRAPPAPEIGTEGRAQGSPPNLNDGPSDHTDLQG